MYNFLYNIAVSAAASAIAGLMLNDYVIDKTEALRPPKEPSDE